LRTTGCAAGVDERIAKVQYETDKLQRKQKEVSNQVNERSSGKGEIRAQLDEVKGKNNALQQQKEAFVPVAGRSGEKALKRRTSYRSRNSHRLHQRAGD